MHIRQSHRGQAMAASSIDAAIGVDANELQPIPDDPTEAMTALCRSAMFYQWLLEKCVARHPDLADVFTDDERRGIRLADDTIRH